MVDFVRTAALSFACTLAACRHDTPSIDAPVAGSAPIAEVEGGGAPLAIVAVPQMPASETSQWLFEPGGHRLASTELGDCSIWDVETGRLVRQLELVEPPPPACAEWLPSVGLQEFVHVPNSTDGKLELSVGQHVEIFDTQTGTRLRELACPSCADAGAISWSTSGHQLAMLWTEPLRFETWDADTGKRLTTELIPPRGTIDEFVVAWSSVGPIVALTEWNETAECNENVDACEWDEDGNLMARQVLDRRILVGRGGGLVEIDLGREQGTLDDLELDPEGQWIYWIHSWDERRAGTNSWLHFVGLGDRTSGLGWEHVEEYGDYEATMTREGQWRSDGATHWLVEVRRDDFEGQFSELEWETTLTHPPLGRRHAALEVGADLDSEAEVEVELFGFADEAIRYSGQVCENETCRPLGSPLPPDCLVLDIGSNHGAELLDCGGRVHLRNRVGLSALPLDADATFWWWGRSGALVLDDATTLMVIDAASGKIGLQRADVDVLDGKLGTEIDRVILVGEAKLELLDLTNLQVVLELPGASPVAVAFSPTGDRLALLERDELRVLALPGGEPRASWPIQAIDDLAFRQDGKVIYVGSDRPEAGYDAVNGEPLNDPLLFAAIADAIDSGGEIDPGWRWIMDDEFGQLVRTSDARTLEWLDEGARLPDTGQYSGKPPGPELAFRIGSDAWAVPEFDSTQLEPWLERPDLVEAFLTGQAIAKPTITAAELAALRAQPPAKQGPTP